MTSGPHDPSGAEAKRAPGRPRFDHGSFAVVAVLLAAPFVAFPAAFIPHALLDGGDDLLANLPGLVYSGRQLLRGEVLWMPELWMGQPLLAEPEFATFYLPKLMLLVGSPVIAYAAYLVLHYLAAEASAYFYLKSLGIGRLGAVFGALAYAYAGFMLGHRAHTMYVCAGAWTPLVLLLFDRATDRGGRWTHLGATFAFAMVPFSGAVQLTVYLTWLIVMLATARAWFERSMRPVVGAAKSLVPALLVSAAQLVPSYDLSGQLATGLRSDYALAVAHSFHPFLLPTLALPVAPIEGELYSRAGVVVLAAAVVALVGIRSAPVRVRAWAVVLAVALVLMLGGYLPPLARALHELPVVGVMRGPARHNFELGLALSVLGAYGFEAARRAATPHAVRWLAGGAAFSVLSFVSVRLAADGHVADVAARSVLLGVTPSAALAAAMAFVVWVAALHFRGTSRMAATLWATIAVAPALETAWVMRVEAWPNRSALGLIEVASGALPEPPRSVRLLSVSLHRGSADDLAGNSILLHSSVESLQAYASISYSDAREVLDLDMHGQPKFYHELAFSSLPSVFGVTHVVLPSVACGDVRLSLAAPGTLCARERGAGGPRLTTPQSIPSGQSDCTALVTDTTFRHRIEVAARATQAGALGAAFAFEGAPTWTRRFALEIPGPWLGSSGVRRTQPVRLRDTESFGGLRLENHARTSVDFWDTGLFVERDATVAALGPLAGPELRMAGAVVRGEFVRLLPSEGVSRVERRVRWPEAGRSPSGIAVLEAEARAASPGAGDLVVDLHADGGYDPDEAELVIGGSELGPEWRSFRREIRADGVPGEFFLRVVSRGAESIDLREARLAARTDERVVEYPVAVHRHRRGVSVGAGKITLDAGAVSGGLMHLPVRAFDVLLDAEAHDPLLGPVSFGLAATTRFEERREWRVDSSELTTRVRAHRIAILPPDVHDPKLFVRVDGKSPLQVNELSATDACAVRGYRNPRGLANGLFLYENPHALPRAYTVGETTRVEDALAGRRALLDFGPSELGRRAVVTDDVPANLRAGVVEHAVFGQRKAGMTVTSTGGPTLLVVNERFDPNWRATIDGVRTMILPINGLVRGIVVPEGRHAVHLEYRAPVAVWIGMGLAIAGLLVALSVLPALERSWRWATRKPPNGAADPPRGTP